ncbi:hypothetical protein [Streptomyces sp. NPDC101115]|uniref:hypothetical protein n=1 Tax=Streptomyces sp. NPDC101115 TaxID=3366106 RepID=UPI0037FE465E
MTEPTTPPASVAVDVAIAWLPAGEPVRLTWSSPTTVRFEWDPTQITPDDIEAAVHLARAINTH